MTHLDAAWYCAIAATNWLAQNPDDPNAGTITRAVALILSRRVEAQCIEACVSNLEADIAEGKFDNWKPRIKPPLGPLRKLDTE